MDRRGFVGCFVALTGMLHVAILRPLPAPPAGLLEVPGFGPFEWHCVSTPSELLPGDRAPDALIVEAASASASAVADAAADTAVLVIAGSLAAAVALPWLQRGVQDVLLAEELASPTFGLRLRAAIERKRLELEARTAYATDLETGLPHQQQFIEHMSQLIALREREPAPMAVLALRIEGLATVEARFGRDAAHALRRKVGVRLRVGVRASDVVASLGDDVFAVLLGSMLAPEDAVRVGAKLLKALMTPFKVSLDEVPVAAALGIGQYPQDGAEAHALLRRAVGLAAATQAQGRSGPSIFGAGANESDASVPGAANDE